MRLKAKPAGEGWVVIDEDDLPGDEHNYYGWVAFGFDTKEEALDYIRMAPTAQTKE